MRKSIGWLLSWALYWLGDLTSKIVHTNWGYRLYPVYNCLMCRSVDVQDWSKIDNGPWGKKNQ